MRRRDFLTLLGAAVAWPRPAIGQSPSKVYRVGLLSAGAPIVDNSSQGAALIRGFTQRGYKLGRNLAFERRGCPHDAADDDAIGEHVIVALAPFAG